MPILIKCKACGDDFDECGGSMSRGRHYTPYCSRYCQMFYNKGYKMDGENGPYGRKYPKFDMKCDWCGGPFQLKRGRTEGSQRYCSVKCSRTARFKRNNKWNRVLQVLKIKGSRNPITAHEIAYEISKIPSNGWRNKLGAVSVANVLKRLVARGAVNVSQGHIKTYELKNVNTPFKQFSIPLPKRIHESGD